MAKCSSLFHTYEVYLLRSQKDFLIVEKSVVARETWSALKQGKIFATTSTTYTRISRIRQQNMIGFNEELKNASVNEM